MRKLLLVALVALCAVFVVAPAGLAARGGNAENAKLCQKAGWQSLYTSTGVLFADQGACASYAAKGGTLTTQTKSKSQLDCESLGGTFGRDDQTYDIDGIFPLWTCNGDGVSGDDAMLLDDDCGYYDGGGGTAWNLVGTEGVSAYSCFPFPPV